MPPRSRGKYGVLLPWIMVAGDYAVINGVFFIVSLLNPTVSLWNTRLVWALLNVAYVPVAALSWNVHKERAMHMERILSLAVKAVGSHALIFIALLFLAGIDIGWQPVAEFYGYVILLFPLWWVVARLILKQLRRRGINYTRSVIVGCGETAARLYEEMQLDQGFGYRFMGFFDAWRPPSFKYRNLYRGDLSELRSYVQRNRIDEVFYACDNESPEALRLTMETCDQTMAAFRLVPRISRFVSRQFSLASIGQIPLLVLQPNPLENAFNSASKRMLDLVLSSTFLIISPVIFIPIAIAIKASSPGPVFFKQKRTGYRGREFECYKFRTMRVNDAADQLQCTRNDPRKTRLGEFLRHSSLDELPQFFNVLRGDMSIVGPRPHMLRHTEEYSQVIDKYMARHLVKPGITGWAQVRGYRGQTEELWQMERRVEHDIWYIEHWTFLLDLKIIARTAINIFHSEQNAF